MLINRKHVKEYALSLGQKRAQQFNRVGGEFFVKAEANLKTFIRTYVERLPSKGKTIK